MPKRTAKRLAKPKVTTLDSLSTWLTTILPDGVHLTLSVYQTFERSKGSTHAYFNCTIELDKGGQVTRKQSHNLDALASWVTAIAIPELFPPPRPPERPLRKITVDRPKLEYKPILTTNDLFD